MSVFVISDLHLSISEPEKTMSVFHGWENYHDRIKANFTRLIKPEDTVVIGGDLSWGIDLLEAYEDFNFLHSLPGKKILIKGNHDLWWPTAKKLNEFLAANNFTDISFIYNNCIIADEFAVCGTRGWFYDKQDEKIVLREAARLERSIKAAAESSKKPLLVLHYPPVYGDYVCRPIFDIIKSYGIKDIYHGHIHGPGRNNAVQAFEGVKLHLTSADCIDFTPIKIKD